jgi:hypothetical protein
MHVAPLSWRPYLLRCGTNGRGEIARPAADDLDRSCGKSIHGASGAGRRMVDSRILGRGRSAVALLITTFEGSIQTFR